MTKKISLKSLNAFTVSISMIFFILLWWCAVLIPSFTDYDGIFKRFGLTVLLILISKYFDKDLEIKISEMYCKSDVRNLFCSCTGAFIYLFLFCCLTSQKICSLNFWRWDLLDYIRLFFLALFEEMFFRGWGYNALYSSFNKDKSNLKSFRLFNRFLITLSELKAIVLTNLFFAIIHLQAYVMFYNYNFLQTLNNCISVFMVGVFFTLVFKKTKSIWIAILVQAFWDWILGVIVY